MTVLFHLCLCVMLLVDTCCEELCFDVRCFAWLGLAISDISSKLAALCLMAWLEGLMTSWYCLA